MVRVINDGTVPLTPLNACTRLKPVRATAVLTHVQRDQHIPAGGN
jgi:hypothetical protein